MFKNALFVFLLYKCFFFEKKNAHSVPKIANKRISKVKMCRSKCTTINTCSKWIEQKWAYQQPTYGLSLVLLVDYSSNARGPLRMNIVLKIRFGGFDFISFKFSHLGMSFFRKNFLIDFFISIFIIFADVWMSQSYSILKAENCCIEAIQQSLLARCLSSFCLFFIKKNCMQAKFRMSYFRSNGNQLNQIKVAYTPR